MIEVSVTGAWALVELSGEFDLMNADEIRSVVADLAEQAVTDVTVDLSGVTLMGAAGLHSLEAAGGLMEDIGGRLLLLGASGQIRRVFEATGIDRSLPFSHGARRLPASQAATTHPSAESDPDSISAIGGQLFGLSQRLLTERFVTGDLRRVVRSAVRSVPGATAASVTLLARGKPRSAVVSDSVAIEVDVAQYALDEGPCLDAAVTSERVRVNVLAAEERFTHLAPLAARAGVKAVLSVPVTTDDTTVGSLNVYSDAAFPPDAEAWAGIIAAQAAIAIVKAEIYAAARRAAALAQHRLHVDQDINVAQGAVAELQDCSLQQARLLLRSAASTNGETLHEVARRIIASLDSRTFG